MAQPTGTCCREAKTGKGVGTSPRRQEEDARVSSSRSPSAVAIDASFRSSGARSLSSSSSFSSLASDVESSDDGDGAYPWTQCEYEEIPDFRWIATPLRWWKTKKGSDLSRNNTAQARTATTEKEPGTPAGGSRASETSSCETRDVRPEMQEVLQQLEYITSKFEKTTHSPTTKGGNKPNDAGSAAASTIITTASPATGERTTSPFKDDAIQTPWTSNNFAHDENLLQPCATENLISSPLASSSEAMPDPINSCKHKDENLPEMTPQDDLKDSEIPNPTQAEEITQKPFVNEELDALNPAEHRTEVRMDMERCNAMPQGTGVSPLSSIDWATVDVQVRLDVPTSPPLISSDPDIVYQRYFRTLYDLAHRSPPLPCNVLEVQLNRMIMGLHSLGYPLDTWVKAANLVLIHTKKQEYIDQHVNDYKLHVEMQLKGLTSTISPAKEEITGTQSEIPVLEQKQEELDETIANLEDQLALLKTQRQEVVNSLTAARDVLAVAEAKVELIFVRMNCLNQQYSATSNLRRAMVRELPSLDEIFDSNFQEIMWPQKFYIKRTCAAGPTDPKGKGNRQSPLQRKAKEI